MCDSNIKHFDDFTTNFRDYNKDFEAAKTKLINYKEKTTTLGTYTIVTIGMGCCVYLKYIFKNKLVIGYFLHSDNYGQYGESTNDHLKAKNFVLNYTEV